MKTAVTFQIDTDSLSLYTDEYLAQLWHIAQANPAPIEDVDAGRLAEYIGREIIRRFLVNAPTALWSHQGHHAYFTTVLDLQQRHPELKIEMPRATQPHDDGHPVPDPELMATAPPEYTEWEKRVWCRGFAYATNVSVERGMRL